MIAKVIVDVPAAQTDRSFDYEIPEELEQVVDRGMRVIVPFGPRKVQGFVVQIEEQSSVKKLKQIEVVQDVAPVLNEELLELGDWLSETTLCYKISAYQAMLPSAMRAKVNKWLIPVVEQKLLPPELHPIFSGKEQILYEDVRKTSPHLLPTLKKAVQLQLLDVDYEVRDKGRSKKQRIIRLAKTKTEIEKLLSTFETRAKKQKELLEYLLVHDVESIPTLTLMKELDTTRSTVKALLDKGFLIETEEERYRDPFSHRTFAKTEQLPLTNGQAAVYKEIKRTIEEGKHETFLIHGVTGSGKTEIYLQAIEHVLQKGQEAIVLVPEISLTPQMVERFKGRFGSQVAVLHSGLSVGEKFDEWRKIHRKEVSVVVGARSAVFAPFENLGILIIDEEHESSYKQEDNPRYHARDVAIYRGQHFNCPVILGSATPSLESYARAKKGVYTLLSLLERVNQQAMPEVNIVDMREELRTGNRSMFSHALFEKMKERLEKGEQIVLFLNRRGYSTFVMCRDCGYVAMCESCDISLTYHRSQHMLRCHYCGHEERMITTCQACESEHVRYFGTGTQKVEEELGKLLPEARVIRMDVDTTRRKGSHEKLLTAFGEGKADILLGTQMIAKGLDFPNITLVGIIAADSMLHLPDFRSAERTYQLLEQVSGRAGRHQLQGEVIVQTYTPEHYSIELLKEHDYVRFFEREMWQRKISGYPPYYYLTLINISHQELTRVITVTEKIANFLREHVSDEAIVLGPVASPIVRMKDRYRYQCVIKYKNEPKLTKLLEEIKQHYVKEIAKGDLQINIDMNPYMFM